MDVMVQISTGRAVEIFIKFIPIGVLHSSSGWLIKIGSAIKSFARSIFEYPKRKTLKNILIYHFHQ